MDDLSFNISAFPALEYCLILETSYEKRETLKNHIVGIGAFSKILEAEALGSSLSALNTIPIDVCCFGPSITNDRIADVISLGRNQSAPEDCAYAAFIAEGDPRADSVEKTGIHSSCELPYSKARISTALIIAVSLANAGGSWASLVLENTDDEELISKITLAREEQQHRKSKSSGNNESPTIKRTEISQDQKLMVMNVLSKVTNVLDKIERSIDSGKFTIDETGNPTEITRAGIDDIVDEMLRYAEDSEIATEVKGLLNECFLVWVNNYIRNDRKVATDNLRQSIAAFAGSL